MEQPCEKMRNKTDVRFDEAPRWISVDDALPKVGETVIVYTTESLVSVRRCYLDTMVISNTTDIPYWSVFPGRVLYWMPLPEPPEEGE